MSLSVICDFDGTAADCNVARLLLARFGGEDTAGLRLDYRDGKMTFREYQEQAFLSADATIDEMAAYAAEQARLRPGFAQTVAATRKAGGDFRIVSSGLDFYISAVLERCGFADIPVLAVCTSAEGPNGASIRYDYQRGQKTCRGDWAVCKCVAVEAALGEGGEVVFVGDGLGADACAAERASKVFARAALLDHCRERGIPVEPFDDLLPVAAYLAGRGQSERRVRNHDRPGTGVSR